MYLSIPNNQVGYSESPSLIKVKVSESIRKKDDYTLVTTEIIEGCLQNDRKCQRMLYEFCYPILMKVCYRYTNNKEEATETMNICFMKVLKSLTSLSDINSIGGWVKQIGVYTAIDQYRSKKRYQNRTSLSIDTEYSAVQQTHAGLDFTESKMDSKQIIQALQELPSPTREVMNMFAIDGFSHKEIAVKLDLSEEASRWHLHKARKLMTEKLQELHYYINKSKHAQRK